ncbi:MAG: hypothetical protein J3K34DRAFT_412302, partial [Monoraphidium minutum]
MEAGRAFPIAAPPLLLLLLLLPLLRLYHSHSPRCLSCPTPCHRPSTGPGPPRPSWQPSPGRPPDLLPGGPQGIMR